MLQQNDEIAPVEQDYRAAASIRAKATRQGAPLELADCLIAAVAVRLGRPLVTGNTDDFSGYPKNRSATRHRELARTLPVSFEKTRNCLNSPAPRGHLAVRYSEDRPSWT